MPIVESVRRLSLARRIGVGVFALLSALVLPACAAHFAKDGPHDTALKKANIHYEFRNSTGDTSATTPLVFVHGWACDHTHWDKQILGLPTDRAMLAIDLPGYGASTDGGEAHSMDLYADAIAEAMDDAGLDRAVIIGHSMGTPVARQFFRRYPERTVGLVGVDGALRTLGNAEQVEEFVAPLYTDQWQTFAAVMFDGMSSTMREDSDREHVREVMLATPQASMIGGFEAMNDPGVWRDDPITVPVLLMLADSPFWNDEYVVYVNSIIADLEIVRFPGASHFLMLDDPEKFNAVLLSWLVRQGL